MCVGGFLWARGWVKVNGTTEKQNTKKEPCVILLNMEWIWKTTLIHSFIQQMLIGCPQLTASNCARLRIERQSGGVFSELGSAREPQI